MKRRTLLTGLGAVLAPGALLPKPAAAQVWAPSRPVRIVVPFSAGGSTDLTARILAGELSPRLGQPVVVENRPGASGNIAAEAVARATPDGHTLLLGTSTTIATNPALFRRLPFDVAQDFAPVSLTAFIPNLLVCTPRLPVRDVPGLIAYGKANPGKLSYGSSGPGASQHLAGALLAQRAGIEMEHIPYRGGSLVVTDVIAGTVDICFAPLVEAIEHVRAGRLRALAVSTLQRVPGLPEVPTVAETLPGFEIRLWNGVLAPAATPAAAVERISKDLVEVLRMPGVRAKLEEQGSEPAGNTPGEFAAFIREELPRWAELVRISGATVE